MDDAQEPPSEYEGTPEAGGSVDAGAGWNPPPPPPLPQEGAGGPSWPPQPGANYPPSYPGWGPPSWPAQPPPNPWVSAPGPSGTWPGSWSPDPGGPAGGGAGPGGWITPWSPGSGGPVPPRRTLPGAITALLLVVAVLVGLGLGHGVWRSTTHSITNGTAGNGPGNSLGQNPNGGNGSGSSGNSSAIAAKAAPALVDINTDLSFQGGQAAGTGIVITSNGLVLTNNHVISGATRISATDVGNGKSYTGVVVGYDRSHDIAVVQLQDASNLITASIGDSSKVSVGDQIVGLGNAGGVGGTPSTAGGTVTALGQSITATDEGDGTSEQLAGLIQVNANIQPGDSGGALVDANGNVIGVDTAASAGFSFQTAGGEGYAIPINQAVTIGRQISSGQGTDSIHIGPTAFLGVLVSVSNTAGPGATLAQAVPNGPADKAGLTTGDVITSIAGHTVDKPSTLTDLILGFHPGDKVKVGWSDSSGGAHQATVTLGTGPAQ
jgi:S1-C subfamily serine protease